MTITRLKHRIKIYTKQFDTDEAGGNIETETLRFETYAAIKQVSTSRIFLQGLDVEKTTYQVHIRYDKTRDIRQFERIEYAGKSFVIIGQAENVSNKFYTFLMQQTDV